MAITEGQRRLVHSKLETAHGPEVADLLMEMLPHQSHDELVTRADMAANTAVLRGEMAELRGQLQGEMADLRSELRGEMADLRSELRGEMADLRSEMCTAMAELRVDVKAEIAGLQRWGAGVVAANAVAVFSALLL